MPIATALSHSPFTLAGALAAIFALAMPVSAAPPPGFKSTMATADQDAVEKMVAKIIADPRVLAAKNKARAIMENHPLAQIPDGKTRLAHVLDAWTTYLAFQEANADPDRPRIVWSCTTSDYTWNGRTVPGGGASIDNPDNIYRHIPIDGAASYEIHGKMRPMHPGQFSFQLLRHSETIPPGRDSTSYGVINSRDMQIAADGTFTVTVGPEPANGRPNHMQTQSGPLLRLLVRDTLPSWMQSANELTVKRVSGPAVKPAPTVDAISARVAEELEGWVKGWVSYVATGYGPPAENTLVVPYGRSGGWGYISPMRYNLADDQAIVITIDSAAAEYAAVQLTDVWTIAFDPQRNVSSYTTSQSRMNPDGTYTYVVSMRDPGVGNWLNPIGIHQGWIAFRWQGVPRTRTNSDGLIRDFRVVKTSELASILKPTVTPDQRKQELEQRMDEWRLRIATGK
jgi:hypothetical protein